MPTDTATQNPLARLAEYGQSPWLDFIRRGFLADGSLARLIAEDGVRGVTSNPAIFEKAIAAGADYDAELAALAPDPALAASDIFEHLAVADIRAAADILRPVFDETGGADGYVSLEVSPYLAHDTAGTIAEAKRLFAWVDRPNLMMKVPGTASGTAAIRALIEAGIPVNVTLLFAQSAYRDVAEAYLAGLEARLAQGLTLAPVASVASFFVSRIDTVIDRELARHPDAAAGALRGRVAIANAKCAYAWYREMVASPRWQRLAAAGARPQRLLWASTGTKDPAYRDVLYVEELIGADTVNTIPPATLDAFRDHGAPRAALADGLDEARATLAELARLGIDLDAATDALVADGVRLFIDAADTLLGAVAAKRAALLGDRLVGLAAALPAPLAASVAQAEREWTASGRLRALWARDAAVWTNGPEAKWLRWLDAPRVGRAALPELLAFQADVRAAGFTDLLLIGMGGSSLGPEVLGAINPPVSGFPRLTMLDSTSPVTVARVTATLDCARTLVIVASKSGSTLEPSILLAAIHARFRETLGEAAARHFVAITDPGSKLEAEARAANFRAIFLGDPEIGGRFSVLSPFGLVPAAALGLDLPALLDNALLMASACAAQTPAAHNPGARLGLILGEAARAGADKLTLVASPGFAPLGAWLEQLIAESTGKHGQAILPFDGEALATPDRYGHDRIFAYLRGPDAQPATDRRIDALQQAGFPVIRLTAPGPDTLAQHFFLWEFATAVAGSVMRLDPFDQPDVEASKVKTRALTNAYTQTGALPADPPFAVHGALSLYADPANAAALPAKGLADILAAHVARIVDGDYVAILAYLDRDMATIAALDTLREALRARTRAPVAVQFGPRFLHSTGQAYKGGPASAVFLQITETPATDLPVPGQPYSFGIVLAAQAEGDLGVLTERGRRALRVHIAGDLEAGLAQLAAALA